MRILAVLASPFPSRQGTQVLVHNICEGLARRGHDVHLLVYAHGAFSPRVSYAVHRLPDLPRFRSLRSGPDPRRVALDLALAARLRLLARKLSPDAIHLHNVEAAAAALLVPPRPAAPCVYHAHNVMAEELPTYLRPAPAGPARALGALLDRTLAERADLTLAVSPATRSALVRLGADPARVVVVEPGVDLDDLDAAAGSIAIHATPAVVRARRAGSALVGYLGNLDAYQGLDLVLGAVAAMRRDGIPAELLVVSESDPGATAREAARRGIAVRFERHGALSDALGALSACDVAVVGRNVRGGFPVKLAVLLAAGIPAAATPAAVEGLEIDDVVWTARDGSAEALGSAAAAAVRDGVERAARVERGLRLAGDRWSAAAAAGRLEEGLRSAVEMRGPVRTL